MVFSRAPNAAASEKVPVQSWLSATLFLRLYLLLLLGNSVILFSPVGKLHPPRSGINHCSSARRVSHLARENEGSPRSAAVLV